MEDMCQLSSRMTEDKYHSSYEHIAKTIKQFSTQAQLDVVNFLEVVFFSWLTGNNDMHLKNFSLYAPDGKYILSPAYDLINVSIVNPKDNEELALTLNGRKRKLSISDFVCAAQTMDIPAVIVRRMVNKFMKFLPEFEKTILSSFLNPKLKEEYISLIRKRLEF